MLTVCHALDKGFEYGAVSGAVYIMLTTCAFWWLLERVTPEDVQVGGMLLLPNMRPCLALA